MNKDELRPVEFQYNGSTVNGYFHMWYTAKWSDNGEEYPIALIKDAKGNMLKIEPKDSRLKFTDR